MSDTAPLRLISGRSGHSWHQQSDTDQDIIDTRDTHPEPSWRCDHSSNNCVSNLNIEARLIQWCWGAGSGWGCCQTWAPLVSAWHQAPSSDTQHCYIAAHPNLNQPPKFYSLRSRVRDQRVDKTLTNERPARGHALVTPANQREGENIRVERNQWFTSAAIKSIYCSNIKYFNLTKAHQATHCNFHWKKRGFKNSNLSG